MVPSPGSVQFWLAPPSQCHRMIWLPSAVPAPESSRHLPASPVTVPLAVPAAPAEAGAAVRPLSRAIRQESTAASALVRERHRLGRGCDMAGRPLDGWAGVVVP